MKKALRLSLVFLGAGILPYVQASCSLTDQEEAVAESLILEAQSGSFYLIRKLALKTKENIGVSMAPEELSKMITDIYRVAYIDCVKNGMSFNCSSTATDKIAETFARDLLE